MKLTEQRWLRSAPLSSNISIIFWKPRAQAHARGVSSRMKSRTWGLFISCWLNRLINGSERQHEISKIPWWCWLLLVSEEELQLYQDSHPWWPRTEDLYLSVNIPFLVRIVWSHRSWLTLSDRWILISSKVNSCSTMCHLEARQALIRAVFPSYIWEVAHNQIIKYLT